MVPGAVILSCRWSCEFLFFLSPQQSLNLFQSLLQHFCAYLEDLNFSVTIPPKHSNTVCTYFHLGTSIGAMPPIRPSPLDFSVIGFSFRWLQNIFLNQLIKEVRTQWQSQLMCIIKETWELFLPSRSGNFQTNFVNQTKPGVGAKNRAVTLNIFCFDKHFVSLFFLPEEF